MCHYCADEATDKCELCEKALCTEHALPDHHAIGVHLCHECADEVVTYNRRMEAEGQLTFTPPTG